MSIFHPVQALCSHCGKANTVQRTASVNADRRPELRTAILDGSFQREICTHCDTALRLPPHLIYIDMGRQQWFMVEPPATIDQWQAAEQAAHATWARAFGPQATPHGREMGASLHARLVLGWPALREKLLCATLGLDDVTLELLKLDLLPDMDAPPLADQTELRLVKGDTEWLHFAWLELASERAIEGVEVPRSAYDELLADPDNWAELRERFEGALLVDWRRLMFEGAAP